MPRYPKDSDEVREAKRRADLVMEQAKRDRERAIREKNRADYEASEEAKRQDERMKREGK